VVRRRRAPVLLSPRWVAVHLAALVLVAAFLSLGWWQVNRAAAGNLLSFGYALEWPLFAGFVVWIWIVEMRKALRAAATPEQEGHLVRSGEPDVGSDQPAPPRRARARNAAAYDDSDDPQLAAYNHYLAWLNAHPHLTPADYPGMTAKETP
jgi:DNA-binding transcriptional regulator of glucitol operon